MPHFFDPWSIPSALYPCPKESHSNSSRMIHVTFNASGTFKVVFLTHTFANPGDTLTFFYLKWAQFLG